MPVSVKLITKPKEFMKNATSVMARWAPDGLYYQVKILDCKPKEKKCEVIFEDGHKCWLPCREIHAQIKDEQGCVPEQLLVCCVCDDDSSEPPNEMLICETCYQGYHLQCHNPPVDREEVSLDDETSDWLCNTCEYIGQQPINDGNKMKREKPKVRRSSPITTVASTVKPEVTDYDICEVGKKIALSADVLPASENFASLLLETQDEEKKALKLKPITAKRQRKPSKRAPAY